MRLESGAEVAHADDGIGDSEDDKKDGNDGKGCERLSHGSVRILMSGLVDSDKLEDEVAQAAEIENDDDDLAGLVFSASEVGGSEQDGNGDRDSGDGQGELGIRLLGDDNDELNDEPEEKEEIELEQCDVDLFTVSFSVFVPSRRGN